MFDPDTTLAILAGFAFNRRVMVQGYHGTGKSTHIEQVAARLKWPCIRINLDAHISRIDLIGRDAIVLRDGQQVTEFREGLLPWALQTPTALVFDEYDAGRPDVMFVIQRVLETEGKLTLLDQNRVIRPNPWFRLFATANTVGLGDTSGLYHGTQQINQGQMDRWNIVVGLNYLPAQVESEIVLAKSTGNTMPGGGRSRQHGQGRRPHPAGLHQRRHFDRDEPTYGHHLGAEHRHLQGCGLCVPVELPQQVRRSRARVGGRILSARLRQGSARKRRRQGMIRFATLAMTLLALGGCGVAVEYGDVPHSQLVDNPRCNPAQTDPAAIAGKDYFAVTSRLPDCQNENIKLTIHRTDRMRYARFAPPLTTKPAKGDKQIVVPLAFQPESDWWDGLRDAANLRKGRVLLYVHGYRETFPSTAKDTVQIAALTQFDGPIIQYSWPSQGNLLSYAVDETNMYWDQAEFSQFPDQISAGTAWVKEIVIVSHSLGARLVVPAVEYVDRSVD